MGRVYCPHCRKWGNLLKKTEIKKNKKITVWWFIHKKNRHKVPSYVRPSPYVEVLTRRSLAELKLEKSILKRNIKFIVQKRISLDGQYFVVDFLVENKIIVECEGRVHQERLYEDNERQKLLESNGYVVIRFANLEIFDHVGICVDKIEKVLEICTQNNSHDQLQVRRMPARAFNKKRMEYFGDT